VKPPEEMPVSSAWRPFVPDQVLDLLSRHPSRLPLGVPARVSAAVLFADIAGFTRISEALASSGRHGAEELNQLLCGYFGQVIEQVVGHGGSVVRFAGDAVLAVFPAEDRGQPAATRSAVQCALDMQSAIVGYREVITGAGSFQLAVKVGLAVGPVIGVVLGEEQIRLEYVLMGPTVDQAAAAEHRAERGEVLVDQSVLAACEGIHVTERRGRAYRVGGLTPPVVAGPVPAPARVADAVAARLAPFLHRPVAARLLAGRRGLVNEHRKVSVAFVAFPGLDTDANIAAGAERLQEYVVAAVRTIDRHGGHLLQIDTGDKGHLLVVCFGAPVSHEEDEERAVRCCLDLLSIVPGGPFRAGLTTAFAYCGEVGSERRREYLVVGDSVNVAARLMQAAKPGQLLVDRPTHDRVKPATVQEPLPPITAKGKTERVPVWAVRGLQERGSPGAAAGDQLVGRERELTQLGTLLRRAAAGQGRLVVLTGEAGVGKSRLAAEAVRLAEDSGFAAFHGAARATETETSYLLWRPVCRRLLGVDAKAPIPAQQARLREYVSELDVGSAQRAPLLAPVVNVPIGDSELTATLDAATRSELLRALLADMLRQQTVDGGPVLVVLEDCHWIDPSSAALLHHLARTVADQRVVFLLTARPRLAAAPALVPLAQLGHCAEIALSELPGPDAERLVADRLRRRYGADVTLSPELLRSLTARGDGNPLYLEELASFAFERGLDPRDADAVAALELPGSLHALLTARLDQLAEGEQATVKVASVIGRAFRASWVQGAYPALGRLDAVRAHLDRLHRLDLTRLRSMEPEPEYTFRHVLTQEVAYDTLSFATRARLHEAVGRFIEHAYPDRLAEHSDALAYHYGRTTNTAKQRTWFRAAGDAARSAFANEVAIGNYQRLLPLLPLEHAGDVLVELGGLWQLIGQWSDAERVYRQAMSVAESVGDRALLARSQRDLGVTCTFNRKHADAVSWLTRAGAEFERLGDVHGVASTLDRLSFAHFQLGRYPEALAQAERHLALATTTGDQGGRAAALENMGLVHGHTSNYSQAIDLLNQALQVAKEAGHQHAAIYAANDLAGVYVRQGDHVRALEYLDQARAVAERIGFRPFAAQMIGNAGELYREHGDYPRALACFSYALRTALGFGYWSSALIMVGNLGLTALGQGRVQIAEQLLDRAVTLARELVQPYMLCEFQYWLAKTHADQGRGEDAARCNDEAFEIAERIDHRHHRLHCRLLSVRLAYASGRTDRDTAAEQVRALLAGWPEPAEQAAIHAELWQLTGNAASRAQAARLYRDLYRRAPSEEARERLAQLSDEPLPAGPALPPLPAEVTDVDVDLESVLRQVDTIQVEPLSLG
jgi:class 3 adenylate cyclase/tetratricopeptide (TPR) repeat protein